MTDVITITDNTLVVPSISVQTVEVGYIAQTVSSGGGVPASTVTDETTYGVAKVVGTATSYAREDHTHGSPALGATGTTAAAGNHGHAGLYDASGAATSAVAAHVAASDPHGDRAYASGLVTSEASARTSADALLLPLSTVTTKGDLLAATANATIARLAVGSNGQVLAADSGQAAGVRWVAPPSSIFPVAGYGLLALSAEPIHMGNANAMSTNTVQATRVWVPAGAPIASIWLAVKTAGTYDAVTTPNQLGLYDDTGAKLDQTANDATLWTATGWRGGAIGTPIAAQASGRFVYILGLVRGMANLSWACPPSASDPPSYQVTGPAGGNRRSMYATATALPASFTPSTYGTATSYLALVGIS